MIPSIIDSQAPLSMGFSRQEQQSGLPFPPPGDLPDPGIKLKSPALTGRIFIAEPPDKPTGGSVKVKSLSRARLFAAPWTVACTKLLCPWDFQGKSTGVGCHFLLQGIFPTQGSNPGLSHCRQMLYPLSHQGSK